MLDKMPLSIVGDIFFFYTSKNIFLGIIFEKIYPSSVLYFHYNIILILTSAFCNIRFLIVAKRYK